MDRGVSLDNKVISAPIFLPPVADMNRVRRSSVAYTDESGGEVVLVKKTGASQNRDRERLILLPEGSAIRFLERALITLQKITQYL